MESSVRSGDAPDCPARAPRCTNCAAAPGHSAVTISPRWAMDAGDGMPCWRGLVARLIDRIGGGSTTAAPTAAPRALLRGGETQHAGAPPRPTFSRPLHQQHGTVVPRTDSDRRLCFSVASHAGGARARRWTLSSDGAGCARRGKTMTALRLSLTLAALFVSSLGAALGLYAAAFIALDNDIDPFMRDIHQQ